MSKTIINGELQVTEGTFPLSQIELPDGTFETAQVGIEYISPDQHGEYFGKVYRQYFTGNLSSTSFSITILISSFAHTLLASGGFIVVDADSSLYPMPIWWRGDFILNPRIREGDLGISKNNSGTNGKTFYAWADYSKT